MSCPFQFNYSLRVGGGERRGCQTRSLEKCFNRPAFISHPYRFSERRGVGPSLITEKHSEMNGKRLVDIKIQTKTDQTRNFLQPILDTSHSASVRTVHQGPHGAAGGLSTRTQFPLGVKGGPQCCCFSPLGLRYTHLNGQEGL